MENRSIFASNLRRYMKLSGKSRHDISDALSISYFTVTTWTNGSKYPRIDKIEKLAAYFGIRISDLIEEKADEKQMLSDRHLEMIRDEDLNEIFDSLKMMDETKRKIAKTLIKSLAEAELSTDKL